MQPVPSAEKQTTGAKCGKTIRYDSKGKIPKKLITLDSPFKTFLLHNHANENQSLLFSKVLTILV